MGTPPDEPSLERTCILVLGMHRSGTSAVTRVVSLLGAALPRNLMQPSPNNNVLGFWEPLKLSLLHDQMLAEAGTSWDDWRHIEFESQFPRDRLAHYRTAIARELQDSYGEAPLFVLKDPRMCRFVPLYRQILADMGVAVRVLLAIRHPDSVAASLQARDGIPAEIGRLYWLRHLLDAEAASRDLPRAIVQYEALLGDWRKTIHPVASQIGVEWPIGIDAAAPEIAAFVRPDQNHSPPAAASGTGRDLVWQCYDALLGLPAAEATQRLDAVADSLEAAATLCNRALAAEKASCGQTLVNRRVGAEAALADARMEHAALTAEVVRLQEVIQADRAAHHEALARHHAEAAAQIVAVRAELVTVTDEVARLTTDATAVRSAHAQALARQQAEATATLNVARVEAEVTLGAARAESTRQWDEFHRQLRTVREHADAAANTAASALHVQGYRLASTLLANAKLEQELAAFDRFQLRRLFGTARRWRLKTAGCRILLRALDHLVAAGEDRGHVIWRITGDDPQFDLGWIGSSPLPAGHYRLTLAAPTRGRLRKSGRLYIDTGAGYSEADALDLCFTTAKAGIWQANFILPNGARSLRFDPSSDEPTFVVGKVRLRRLSRLTRTSNAIAQIIASHRHRPMSLVSLAATALLKLLTGGPRSLGRFLSAAAQPTATLPARSWEKRAIRLNTRLANRAPAAMPTIAVHAHIFYIDLLGEVADCLANIPYPTSVYVSTTTPAHDALIAERLSALPNVTAVDVRIVENRGRDIAPMVLEFGRALAKADLVAHLHTKRSPHNLDLRGWRHYLFDSAFGSPDAVRAIVGRFLSDPALGLLFPATYLPVRPLMRIGANATAVRNLLGRYDSELVLSAFEEDFFPAGSVFWCRGSLMNRLLQLQLTAQDFEPEAGQVDGTLAHAVERILPAVGSLDGLTSEEYVIDDDTAGERPTGRIAAATDVLLIDHNLGGGTKVYTNHAVASWLAAGLTVQRLSWDTTSGRFLLQSADPVDGGVISFGDLAAVRDFYRRRRIDRIVVNSMIHFPSPEVCIDLVVELKRQHAVRVVYHMHDFYCVCPSQHLLDGTNGYCGVPSDLAVCAACAAKNLHLWHFGGPRFSISRWRQAFQRLFADCDELVVFDESSRNVLKRAFDLPEERVVVRPHERTVALRPVRHPRRPDLHIGLIGTLNHCKGVDVVNELARYITTSDQKPPLTLVGSSVVPLAGNVNMLGPYEIRDLPGLIESRGITVFLIASIAPETFCYTLDELMAMELPVVAFDLGAQGRRTSDYPHGTVLPAGCPIEAVYRALLAAHGRHYGEP